MTPPRAKLPPLPPGRIRANGLDMAYHDIGQGPPVLLLHGFPGLAYDWCWQAPALAEAGWRVIAPDLRGYGQTGPHGPLEAYSQRNICRDVLGLLDALGLERAVVVGHDFGGVLAWSLARDHAERLLGVISLNTPYLARPPAPLPDVLATVRGPDNYIVTFQTVGAAEAILESDIAETFAGTLRRCALSLETFRADPRLRAIPVTVYGREPAMMGEPIDPEDVAVYVEAYARTGFAGGINWYRNLRQDWLDTAAAPDHIDVPALMVVTDNDFFLPPETTRGMEQRVRDLEFAHIADCGHWTQRERPEHTNAILLEWLERRMRPLV